MEAVLSILERTAFAATLRTSSVLYPLVNALHILGIAILIGSIIALDLRIVGLWRGKGWRQAIGELAQLAAIGLCLAIATGGLLFSVRASDYADNPAMILKVAFIVAGLANAVVFRVLLSREPEANWGPSILLRVGAVVSALIWIAALFSGRWIAFSS